MTSENIELCVKLNCLAYLTYGEISEKSIFDTSSLFYTNLLLKSTLIIAWICVKIKVKNEVFCMIERKNKRNAKIGVFCVAHNTYFSQFDGLYENLMGYHGDFCDSVSKNDVEIIDFGLGHVFQHGPGDFTLNALQKFNSIKHGHFLLLCCCDDRIP
jgi:hypothetical protein